MATEDLKTALLIAIQTTGEERVAKLRQSLLDLGISADKAEELARGLDTELTQIANSAGQAEKKSLDLVTALKTVAGAAIVREFFQVNASFESMQKSLELVTGNSASAAQEMAFVRGEANRLGIEVGSAAASYVNLAASAKGTNLEGAATREIWSAVVGTMAALGKSSADVEGAITQLGQGISKGRFELEDLKSIAERIPGFFKLFADQLGVTTEELFAMISAGELTADKLPQLAEALQKLAGDGGVDSANASLARLKNTWTDVQLSLGQTGGLEAMTTFIKGATVAIAGLWEFVELTGKSIGNLFYTITSGDFSGYQTRQKQAMAEAKADLDKVIESAFGVKSGLEKAGDAGAKAGNQISSAIQTVVLQGPELAKAWESVTKRIESAANATKVEYDLRAANIKLAVEEQRTIYELAKAKGDDAAARAAKIKIVELEIQLSKLNAQADLAGAEASLAAARAKLEQARASGANTEAMQQELRAAELRVEAAKIGVRITDEQASRARALASATDSVRASNVSAAGSFTQFTEGAELATTATHAMADAEQRLLDIRSAANAARQQGGTTSWEYLLGQRGIELTSAQLDAFKAQIQSVSEYLRGTFDGQIVDSTYLIEEAIRRTVELVKAGTSGATSRTGQASGAAGATATSSTATRPATMSGGITININGPIIGGNKEQLARDLQPALEKISRLRS